MKTNKIIVPSIWFNECIDRISIEDGDIFRNKYQPSNRKKNGDLKSAKKRSL